VSLIEEGPTKHVRMANLAIVGSHSTKWRSRHSLRAVAHDHGQGFSGDVPGTLQQTKTNGVTPRRWLLLANPTLANVITEVIGDNGSRTSANSVSEAACR